MSGIPEYAQNIEEKQLGTSDIQLLENIEDSIVEKLDQELDIVKEKSEINIIQLTKISVGDSPKIYDGAIVVDGDNVLIFQIEYYTKERINITCIQKENKMGLPTWMKKYVNIGKYYISKQLS